MGENVLPLSNLHYRGLNFPHRKQFEHGGLMWYLEYPGIGPRTRGTLKQSAGSSNENAGGSETVSTQAGSWTDDPGAAGYSRNGSMTLTSKKTKEQCHCTKGQCEWT